MKLFKVLPIVASALLVCSFLPTTQAAAIEKRDVASEAKVILEDARSQISPIKIQLLSAYKAGDLKDEGYVRESVLPLVNKMANVVSVTASKITTLQLSSGIKTKRQVDENAVAEALAALIREVVEALEPLLDFLGGISLIATLLGTLLARLDADLNTIAIGLGILLGGVLELVRNLLSSLTNALSGLGFLNLLRVLGLLP